jgi:hypothetical protein
MKEKCIDLPNEWKLYTMCNVPQQDTTNNTDCGVFVCMHCNFIQNGCKLDFKQDDITNSDWRDRMILSILSVKPTNDKEINDNDKVTHSAINMKWNNKQKNIARASTWSMNCIIRTRIAKQTRMTRWIVMMIAMMDWIAKTKEYKSAFGKK